METDIVFKGRFDLSEIKSSLRDLQQELIKTIDPMRKSMTGPFKEIIPKESLNRVKELNTALSLTKKQLSLMKDLSGSNKLSRVEGVGPISFKEQLRGGELDKFKELHKELQGIQEVYKTTRKVLYKNAEGVEKWVTETSYATTTTKRFRMELLSIMFFGMNLNRMFSQQTKSMEDLYGLTDLNAAAMELLLLPAYDAFAPIAQGFYEWLINLDDQTQLWIGTLILLVQQTGALLYNIGMFGLGVDGLSRLYNNWKEAGIGSDDGLLGKANGFLVSIWDNLKNIGSKTWSMAVNFLTTGWDRVLYPALMFLSDKGFFSWTDKAWQMTVNFAHKLASGFSNFFSASAEWLKGAVDTTVNFLMGGLNSALSGFMGFLGLGEGGWLRNALGELKVKISFIPGAISGAVSNFFGKFGQAGNAIWAAGGVFTMSLVMLPILQEAWKFGEGIGNWIGKGLVETMIRSGIQSYGGKTGEEGVAAYRETNFFKDLGAMAEDWYKYYGLITDIGAKGTVLEGVIENMGTMWVKSYDSVNDYVILTNKAGQEVAVSGDKFKEFWGQYEGQVTETNSIVYKVGENLYKSADDYETWIENMKPPIYETRNLTAEFGMTLKQAADNLNSDAASANEKVKSALRIMSEMFNNLPGFSWISDLLADLPGFASGGIVTKPTLAMVGESGPEAIVPLNGNTNFGGGITININAPISNSADARSLVDEVARLLQTRLSSRTLT